MPKPNDPPSNDQPATRAPKAERLAAHEAASSLLLSTTTDIRILEDQLAEARERNRVAAEEAERLYGEAFAEEILEDVQRAEKHERDHKQAHAQHKRSCEMRKVARESRGEPAPKHDALQVATIDGATHGIVAAHGLMLGASGFGGGKPREGSRYKMGCGLSVDAAHDELDHERFDQANAIDCPACLTNIAKMDAGEIPSTRSDYLTSKEQIAFVRAENAKRNKQRSPS